MAEDAYHESLSGDLKPYNLPFQDALNLDEEHSPHYKHVNGANPEYDCEVTVDYDHMFVNKPALAVISFNLGETKTTLVDRATSELDVATIFGKVGGKAIEVKVEDIERNKKISLYDAELKVCDSEDKGKTRTMEDSGKDGELVKKDKGCLVDNEDARHNKKTYYYDDDVEEDDIYETCTQLDRFMAYFFIIILFPALCVVLITADRQSGWMLGSVIRYPSLDCEYDEWYDNTPNKTVTKICEGLLCSDGYKKEIHPLGLCVLVLTLSEDNVGARYRNRAFFEFKNTSDLRPVHIFGRGFHKRDIVIDRPDFTDIWKSAYGRRFNKTDLRIKSPNFTDMWKSAFDAVNEISSGPSSGKDITPSKIWICLSVSVPISVVIVIIIEFVSKRHCKRRMDTMNEVENKDLQICVKAVEPTVKRSISNMRSEEKN